MLKGITLAAGGRLANVSGDITVGAGATETLNLTLGADNVNQDAAGAAIIDQGDGSACHQQSRHSQSGH